MVKGSKQWILISPDMCNDYDVITKLAPSVTSDNLWRLNKYDLAFTCIPVAHLKRHDLERFEKPEGQPLGTGWYVEGKKEFRLVGTAGYVREVCDKIQRLDTLKKVGAAAR